MFHNHAHIVLYHPEQADAPVLHAAGEEIPSLVLHTHKDGSVDLVSFVRSHYGANGSFLWKHHVPYDPDKKPGSFSLPAVDPEPTPVVSTEGPVTVAPEATVDIQPPQEPPTVATAEVTVSKPQKNPKSEK